MVETLLVVALLALATSLGVWRLSNISPRARIDRALVLLGSADLAARTLAPMHGPVTLSVAADPPRVVIASRQGGHVLWARLLPTGIRVRIELLTTDPATPTAQGLIHFDPVGRCPDYQHTVLAGVDHDRSRPSLVQVSGMTGWPHSVRETTP